MSHFKEKVKVSRCMIIELKKAEGSLGHHAINCELR